MGSFRTSLGEEFVIERHLPAIGWRPSMRGRGRDWLDLPDFGGGDDLGVFAVIGLFLLALVLLLLLLPFLLFVLELALLLALVIPLAILALVLGVKQHTVVLRSGSKAGPVVDQRQAHGVLGTVRQGRALRAAANSGAYRR